MKKVFLTLIMTVGIVALATLLGYLKNLFTN